MRKEPSKILWLPLISGPTCFALAAYCLLPATYWLLAPAPDAPWGQTARNSSPCEQAEVQVSEGERLVDGKEYAGAITKLRSALDLCPERKDAALELTRAYLGTRQFDQAESTAKKLLERDPRSEAAQFLLAYSYFMQERFQEAGETLKKLLAENTRNADAHKLMGLTLFFYKEDSLAEHELQVALGLRPADAEALYYLGRVYYTQNNFPAAAATFRRVLHLEPRHYKAYDSLGLCYEAMGKTAAAYAAFKKAQGIARDADPTDDWPYADLAEMLIKQDRAQEALPYAEEALRINPRSARDNYLVGKARARQDNPRASLEYLRKAAELDPKYPEPHYLLGQIYEKQGRRADAEREFALFERLRGQLPQRRR